MENLKSIGTILDAKQKKSIKGGRPVNCYAHAICPPYNELACFIYGGVCYYKGSPDDRYDE
ncbi:hypothetical protein J8281_14160 [Aquimarina sp. U1-2]|uniref:hypothetical protein n=1 Tax=Aquimarina sp. U1-2 TaxID=2823141 RepID=UPI001AEC9E8A|nr:hypothetical protein [Aquimarina sp. U1-2]MBP2833335.1 hypothetical protein [Aquimarina sp. U1-2]